ncbi:MAG: ABC transporter ATP-binding protein [Lysobacterales bacterium]
MTEPATPQPLVQLRALSKFYRTASVETCALNAIELCIAPGEYLAITGRSGSGKSTLLSVLGLMEPFDQGSYHFQGRDLGGLSGREAAGLRGRQIGFVFQFFHLIGDLSVADNIGLPMAYAGAGAAAIKARVTMLAERLGIGHRLQHLPGQLSGGQQQRAAIARALVNDPPLLLVDEPTGNLDSDSGAEVMRLLAELHGEGRSICLVSHDISLLGDASRRLEMRDGRLGPAVAAATDRR